MPMRDDLVAAQARNEALRRELEDTKAKLSAAEQALEEREGRESSGEARERTQAAQQELERYKAQVARAETRAETRAEYFERTLEAGRAADREREPVREAESPRARTSATREQSPSHRDGDFVPDFDEPSGPGLIASILRFLGSLGDDD